MVTLGHAFSHTLKLVNTRKEIGWRRRPKKQQVLNAGVLHTGMGLGHRQVALTTCVPQGHGCPGSWEDMRRQPGTTVQGTVSTPKVTEKQEGGQGGLMSLSEGSGFYFVHLGKRHF
jgi:hypothetical protein